VNTIDSLSLFHSWPLFDAEERIGPVQLEALGRLVRGADDDDQDFAPFASDIGLWTCDLANNNALLWSPEVHALFGIPVDEVLTRSLAASCYVPRSRVAMEALRAHAIHHRRGFTLDAMIRRPDGDSRWMRLSAMPVVADRKVVRLIGTKQDVTVVYDGPGWTSV
jgi:PAS domain S-box-containing protein